ncbi:hypothetical protein Q9189_001566 [Teloschistes chrysophthalmus]
MSPSKPTNQTLKFLRGLKEGPLSLHAFQTSHPSEIRDIEDYFRPVTKSPSPSPSSSPPTSISSAAAENGKSDLAPPTSCPSQKNKPSAAECANCSKCEVGKEMADDGIVEGKWGDRMGQGKGVGGKELVAVRVKRPASKGSLLRFEE